jgi:DDE superfamily endonuclease
MESPLRITARERQVLLDQYRQGVSTRVRWRAPILLWLAQGYSWAISAGVVFCRTRTSARWERRVETQGGPAVLSSSPPAASGLALRWRALGASWGTECTPRDCGCLRRRGCGGGVVLRLVERDEVQGSAETIRRGLHREQSGWRRPRPVVGPSAPEREANLQALRQLLATLPADEIAVFRAEVDLNTTPQIGAMWRRRGRQAKIPTPGTTENRALAGSLNWRPGALLVTASFPKEGRSAAWFVRHLDELRRHVLRYRKLPALCDNARSHDCRLVPQYLRQWGHRVVLPYLPRPAPDTNPIERGWGHLHEDLTRGHRGQSLEELLDLVFAWLQKRAPFAVEGSVYPPPQSHLLPAA